jgi:Fe-S-cluster containining protein
MDKFPCSSCGVCCHRIDKAVNMIGISSKEPDSEFYFPFSWDETGKCEMLTKDNKCSVYDNRPTICNIDRLQKMIDIPKDEFYKMNINACNTMMDEAKIDKKFRI